MRRAKAIYRTSLYCYPAPFRHEYGDQMRLAFAAQLTEARRTGTKWDEAVLWMRAVRDVLAIAPREHGHVIGQDVRQIFRATAAKPGFAAGAILSLALGIGANTAIFSLWHGASRAPLPVVDSPDRLLILTDPNATGMWRGRWNSTTDGPRSWVSYAEFEQLRDNVSGFAGLMASQSSLNTWMARVENGQPEEIRGRLVSGGFFDVLGVRPALGRLFSTNEDSGQPLYAVISHGYWQRRFGGRRDVLGRTLTIRDTPAAIIGVAPVGFVGETRGQSPDVWMPLRLQPRLLPGADWLHETPPEKVMWLHVFGRLRPGVTEAQAEAQANGVFQVGLQSFYGLTGSQRGEFLDQRLLLHPGARGASGEQFSASLAVLLVAVGIVLLITCANLANLLMARGAARQGEIAIRVALGGSRGRIFRQLVTESLTLAVAGGILAIAVAWILHGVLVRMLQEAEPMFFASFLVNVPTSAFALAATLGAATAFGVLPAWRLTRGNAQPHLGENSRGTIGSSRELRAGRWLVGLQLALSLPLLAGAGLLVRTVYNLQHPTLGFPSERLLLAFADLGEIARDTSRRDRVLRDLRARIVQIPGVEAATFSQLGLLSDAQSTATIVVEGGVPGERRESDLDRVGPHYFAALGIPIRRGRDISEIDRADSPMVCVVNQAFAQRFFAGRDPIGTHVTTIDDNGLRTAYEVKGVVADARTHGLRSEIRPRFFVPAEQRASSATSRTFLIRTAPGFQAASVAGAVREAMNSVDAAHAFSSGIVTLEERMLRLTAEERSTAWLAAVFGIVALTLAAIGLYGVLSYNVGRRSGEIGIRIALGARPGDVTAMILRESGVLVAAGLVMGGAIAYSSSRLIASRLYGVAPQDPITLALAAGVLLAVSLIAAYVPARRAAKLDPVTALHHG